MKKKLKPPFAALDRDDFQAIEEQKLSADGVLILLLLKRNWKKDTQDSILTYTEALKFMPHRRRVKRAFDELVRKRFIKREKAGGLSCGGKKYANVFRVLLPPIDMNPLGLALKKTPKEMQRERFNEFMKQKIREQVPTLEPSPVPTLEPSEAKN